MSVPNRFFMTLMVFCMLVSGCAQTGTALPTHSPIISTTLKPLATLTATRPATNLPASATITPLPTIPTFTPTFDVRTIVTATPAPKAECPAPNKGLKFAVPTEDPKTFVADYKNQILNFLGKGGDIYDAYRRLASDINPVNVSLLDVTNDGLPELIVAWDGGYIIGCSPKDANYELLYLVHSFDNEAVYGPVEIKDMNQDGIPEIIFEEGYRGSAFFITEWDGEKFQDMIQESQYYSPSIAWAPTSRLTDFRLTDLDHNGTIEMLWKGGVDWPWSDYAKVKSYYREETHVYSWDGKYFSSLPVNYTRPIYRFQAIDDADEATYTGRYDTALSLYQDAIFSDQLDSWSEQRKEQLGARLETLSGTATPTAFPEDTTEYPRLAAYAYYRMLILHTYLNQPDAAQIQYNTLQQKFPAASPGHPYAEMWNAFWNAYQSTKKIYDGCAAAIEYTSRHPETLTPLGGDGVSRIYVPADVCPFR